MTTWLPDAGDPYRRRRQRLARRSGGVPAVLFAGESRSRNYPANTYPYRADSHFLYFVGASLPGAVLLVAGEEAQLFLAPQAPDDALWHGRTPGWDEIAERTKVSRVQPIDALLPTIADLGGPTTVTTLPCADPMTRVRQAELLHRRWPQQRPPRVEDLEERDLALADAVVDLRLRHDDAAISAIRAAVEGTVAAHRAGMAVTRPGLREHDVRAAMERELIARGMEPAYGSIVTIAGEVLHNNDYHHELGPSDLLLADVGAEQRGWASDVTRTWPVGGRFSPTQRALYDVVLQAQRDAIDMVRPKVRYRDIHLRACTTLARGLVDEGLLHGNPESLVERGAHALFFPHGVGHLLGLDVHDMEDLGDRAGYAPGRTRSSQFGLAYLRLDRDLEPGMLVTIEPGIYFVPAILDDDRLGGAFARDGTFDRAAVDRFADVRGIRIEDDVLCTAEGPDVLTAAIAKDPATVQSSVGATSR